MTGGAIVMMVVAMTVLWGGLAAAIVNVVRFKGEEPADSGRDL
ncbi:methionine/alanine import family NSS transporter small subunit [Agrococcus citreus]|uniref:Methionine and alanine importer, small subunit n=1 Tax=Agrococcus citreus TaxID=84643 RepID=A0ABN1YXS7_9MICO